MWWSQCQVQSLVVSSPRAGPKERERDFHGQVHITGPRHHLTSSLWIHSHGLWQEGGLFTRCFSSMVGYAAWFSAWCGGLFCCLCLPWVVFLTGLNRLGVGRVGHCHGLLFLGFSDCPALQLVVFIGLLSLLFLECHAHLDGAKKRVLEGSRIRIKIGGQIRIGYVLEGCIWEVNMMESQCSFLTSSCLM